MKNKAFIGLTLCFAPFLSLLGDDGLILLLMACTCLFFLVIDGLEGTK